MQHRWIARGLATLALTATIVVGSGLAALAHECFNASRSAS